ncbi:A disintegrin and metalloproteinase with thrombospondin motifs 7 isoform X2 [Glossina fuscipes]|uniref:A disintegrin and metalloproteinase with thrombospondin motifs 7 isoform X2 n=1 Tax=Glossina fuscipes TaxID=7396 RepID=A0A9C5Z3F6_9MUSC|nr:A disintegrin and metalloproteinase with thrombospondin motifs 7 isoform X2 [Glossina fuscipes]
MELQAQVNLLICLLISAWQANGDERLFGLFSDELTSGQLIIPRKVTKYGELLTYNLTHHHTEHYQHNRKRRNLQERCHYQTEAEVHYQMDIDNDTLHLELLPHNYFMTPHLIVERHKRDLRIRKKPQKNTNCHYHGKVRGHHQSRVALSTCKGLVGHIKSKNNEYYIEPSKHHMSAHTISSGHPHVVFQRSSINKKQQQQQQQQHILKQQQNPMKRAKKAFSNCGTKEPKRRMEARLVEWQPQGKVKIQGGRRIRRLRHSKQHHNHETQQQQQQQQQQQLYHRHFIQSEQQQQQGQYKYQTTETDVKQQNYHEFDEKNVKNQRNPRSTEPTIALKHTEKQHQPRHQSHRPERMKRSISSPRHVETLIVADATMVAFHDDVETYLLTIMNMVSALYKDPSIGNAIEIVVVKIILLEDNDVHNDLNLTENAQQNLDMFCGWQHKLNTGNDLDPHHHDVAVLITRKNICGNNCMTLGLANVGGMCKPKQSCSVNEDNGIMLSHTIAHELGHNFGMFHDTAKIGCHPRVGSIVHIMTPTFGADTLQVCWSNCSRKFITHFLDQGLGECLDDAPTPLDKYIYPDQLPGLLYNAEEQCRLQYNVSDSEVQACSSMNEICSTLWCRVHGECITNMRPTAPGTICGKRKWCQNGHCVPIEQLTPITGGWGYWSEWSECSRSCGGGVSIQHRECNSPMPANGGAFCIGERKRYKICNYETCPKEEPSFRGQQCEKYNNVSYQGALYKWLPFFDKNNPCKLYCSDEDDTIIANWGDTVLDGTPCTLGKNNMCIDGICKKVGCDWIVDSDMQEDRCGICGGSGEHCKTVKGSFNETIKVNEGYVEVVVLPAKARHIVIKELDNSPHFLGIAQANSSRFYLNGDGLISMPGEFVIAGAESLYDREDEQETIQIPQAIQHSIAIYLIVRSDEPSAGIYYEFTLPALNASSSKQYLWRLSEWTACSVSCGGGLQYQEPMCYENDQVIPDSELCWAFAINARPERLNRKCSDITCPAHWWTGPWQFCPVSCRSENAPLPVRRRSVMCLNQNEILLDDDECNPSTRPADVEYCEQNLPDCHVAEKLQNWIGLELKTKKKA